MSSVVRNAFWETLTPSRFSHALGTLRRKGFIEKAVPPEGCDQREKVLSLTPSGKEAVKKLQARWRLFIEECFRKLGRWVASCHAKDLNWLVEMNVHFVEVVPGRGQVDYRAYLRELAKLPVDAPLMIEHLKTPQEYEEGKRHIQKVAQELELSFA